jgi:hypothetical protein
MVADIGYRRTYKDLVEEVLDKLLLQWSRSQQSVKVSSEQFRDEVAVDE